MQNSTFYEIAFSMLPQIGAARSKALLEKLTPEEVLKAQKSFLEKIPGIGSKTATLIKEFSDYTAVEKELGFIEKHDICPLFITNSGYPKRLLNCYDPPIMLYYKGSANLNAQKIASIVGTRLNSDYGKAQTELLIKELASHDITIVSGLAFGIDTIAHKAALKNDLPTIGVLATGLDTIYPNTNKGLANEMTKNGGLITEFCSGTKPEKHHFPIRNRIVAGMSDVLIVIETELKGGSMITAQLANDNNKEVYALSGKLTDSKNMGCNFLIKKNMAQLFYSTEDMLMDLGWNQDSGLEQNKALDSNILSSLSKNENTVYQILLNDKKIFIDDLQLKSNLSRGKLAAAILNLELACIIKPFPGKYYQLSI